jgi:hypothetical protein
MSTKQTTRQRIDGHPGVYKVGARFQARYRDRITGKVVSRSFPTLEEAKTHKDDQQGFVYSVMASVNGAPVDSWARLAPTDDEIEAMPEVQECVAEYGPFPTDEDRRRVALGVALDGQVQGALSEMLSGAAALDGVADGRDRTARITLKVTRYRSDQP